MCKIIKFPLSRTVRILDRRAKVRDEVRKKEDERIMREMDARRKQYWNN